MLVNVASGRFSGPAPYLPGIISFEYDKMNWLNTVLFFLLFYRFQGLIYVNIQLRLTVHSPVLKMGTHEF